MRKRIVIFILFALILFPLWMWIAWLMQDDRVLKVLILDKTVLTDAGDEHRSFNWVLINEKFTKPSHELYENEKDYFGFFPHDYDTYSINDLEQLKEEKINELVKDNDMTYYTDIYGIYTNDWYNKERDTSLNVSSRKILSIFSNLFGNKKAALERSKLIYGGLCENDILFLKKMKESKKLIITEFNLIANPTVGKRRTDVEEMFKMKWSGWVGRYFDCLDTLVNQELPPWLIRLYKEQHNGKWPFKKSGIALVHEDETIAVLENENELSAELPNIITNPIDQQRFGLPPSIIYSFWFDIMASTDSTTNHIISEYVLHPNSKGDSILTHHHIPKKFPAVFEHYQEDYKFYYFAGDFADNPIKINYLAELKGIKTFRYFLYNKTDKCDRNRFFWTYYNILVSKILNTYYNDYKPFAKK